jgi:hypothetical protein
MRKHESNQNVKSYILEISKKRSDCQYMNRSFILLFINEHIGDENNKTQFFFSK